METVDDNSMPKTEAEPVEGNKKALHKSWEEELEEAVRHFNVIPRKSNPEELEPKLEK
jgi:hypothetical protein